MKQIVFLPICIILMGAVLFSCKKEETTTTSALDGLTKLTEGYAPGAAAKVELWGTKNFFAGYNTLTVVVYDSVHPTQTITDAHIYFEPLMTMEMGMMTKTHAAPVENPASEATDGVFTGAIDFIMPTTEDGTWNLTVRVHTHSNDKEGEASFAITVDSPSDALIKSFVSNSADSSKLFVSLVQPQTPQVGLNDIEFTVFRMASMMDFPADDTCTIEITPEMPSMGHGSPNNVNPVSVGNGHYKGKVNFTMTGDWRINVTIKRDTTVISSDLYFDITL